MQLVVILIVFKKSLIVKLELIGVPGTHLYASCYIVVMELFVPSFIVLD